MAFYSGDVGVVLTFTLTNQDAAALDLTGLTVHLLVLGKTPFVCNVDADPTTGIATYTVAAGDFSPGTYLAQIKVYDAGDNNPIYYTALFNIEVKPVLP